MFRRDLVRIPSLKQSSRLSGLALCLVALIAVVALSGCGGKKKAATDGAAKAKIEAAIAKLNQIHSGRVQITASGAAPNSTTAMKVSASGPFELKGPGAPAFDIDVTIAGGPVQQTFGITAKGGRIFLDFDGKSYDLAGASQFLPKFEDIKFEEMAAVLAQYLTGHKTGAAETIDGVAVTRFTAALDVDRFTKEGAAKLKALAPNADSLGPVGSSFNTAGAGSVKSATASFAVGNNDGLLRGLNLTMEVNAGATGTKTPPTPISLDLTIEGLNEPVTITTPKNAKKAGIDDLLKLFGGLSASVGGMGQPGATGAAPKSKTGSPSGGGPTSSSKGSGGSANGTSPGQKPRTSAGIEAQQLGGAIQAIQRCEQAAKGDPKKLQKCAKLLQ